MSRRERQRRKRRNEAGPQRAIFLTLGLLLAVALIAAGSVVAADTGRTHLRAAAYAAPGSPPATVGTVVLNPPTAGQTRTAVVTAIELVAVNRSNLRRGYLAWIRTATGSPGALAVVDDATAYVVLARQPDGRWLVVADTSELPDGGHD